MEMKDESKCSNLRKSAQNISVDSFNPDDIRKHGAALYVLSSYK